MDYCFHGNFNFNNILIYDVLARRRQLREQQKKLIRVPATIPQ